MKQKQLTVQAGRDWVIILAVLCIGITAVLGIGAFVWWQTNSTEVTTEAATAHIPIDVDKLSKTIEFYKARETR